MLQPYHHATGYSIFQRIGVTGQSWQVRQCCHIHALQHLWGWVKRLHSQKPSNLILWNGPGCRHPHAFPEGKEFLQSFEVGLPQPNIPRALQQRQHLQRPRSQRVFPRTTKLPSYETGSILAHADNRHKHASQGVMKRVFRCDFRCDTHLNNALVVYLPRDIHFTHSYTQSC